MCHSIYSLTEHRLVDAILICESYHLQCNELSKSMRNRLDEISTIDAREWVIYPKQLAHTMVLNWLQYRYYTSYKARTPTLLQENACFGLDHKSCLIQFPYRRTKSIESRSIVEWFSSHARSPWINGRVSLNTDTTCWAAANLTQFVVSSSNLYTDTNRYRISRPIQLLRRSQYIFTYKKHHQQQHTENSQLSIVNITCNMWLATWRELQIVR